MMLKSQGNSFDYGQSQLALYMVILLPRNRHSSILIQHLRRGTRRYCGQPPPHPWAHSFPLLMEMQMERRPCTQQIAPVQLNCHANQKGTNMRGRGENCKCFSNAFQVCHRILLGVSTSQGFPGGSVVKKKKKERKNSPANVGDLDLIPWRRKWQPTPVFCL